MNFDNLLPYIIDSYCIASKIPSAMHHCATFLMFLNPRGNCSQKAIPWWLQKKLIHGVLSPASEAICPGILVQCNSAADPVSLHIQK